MTVNPSASSRASIPSRRSSVTTAATRSVSFLRMNPMPVTVVGESATVATAASVWAVSDISDMSTRDPVEPTRAPDLGPVVTADDLGTHPLEHVDEPQVALQAVRAQTVDPDPTATHRGGGEEVRGRRRIGLHPERRGPVAGRSHRDAPGSGSIADVRTEPLHHRRCVMSTYGWETRGVETPTVSSSSMQGRCRAAGRTGTGC